MIPETNWRTVVTDAAEVRIFEALEDPQWEWRTVSALSRASGVDDASVRKVLNNYPQFVRQSLVPSHSGENIFTLHERRLRQKSIWEKGWDFLGPSSSSST